MLELIDTRPPFSPEPISDVEGRATFRAVVNPFRLWDLTDEQAAVLLDMPLRTYRRWKAGGKGRSGAGGRQPPL